MNPVITTQNLCKAYQKVYRVNHLDLSVPEGSIYGFLGPNGAGKSTTLKMILGLSSPTKGSIQVFGKLFNQKNRLPILRDVGSLIESPSFYGHLTGYENLSILQKMLDVPKKNIDEVLNIVRLSDQKNKKTAHYSLGMKQRLGLAMALLNFPKLLILDEPTNGLDPAGIHEMRELILSLPSKYGMTIVVSSHLLSEIDQIASYVGIIANGELVFQDTIDTLHKLSRQYIALRTENNEAANRLLKTHGYTSILDENYLLFENCKDEQILFMNQILAENNIGILRIEGRAKSLEDIFLSLTNKAVSL